MGAAPLTCRLVWEPATDSQLLSIIYLNSIIRDNMWAHVADLGFRVRRNAIH